MGREQRNKEEKRKYRKTVPMRCLKAIVTILAIPVLVPFLLAQVAFEENVWPWEFE